MHEKEKKERIPTANENDEEAEEEGEEEIESADDIQAPQV